MPMEVHSECKEAGARQKEQGEGIPLSVDYAFPNFLGLASESTVPANDPVPR